MAGANFGYDPEAVIQDADIEMAELVEAGARAAAARRRGLCAHGYLRGDGDPDHPDEQVTCLDCGKVATWDELMAERSRILS